MATQPEIQGFVDDLQQATAQRIHSKKVALGVCPLTTDKTKSISGLSEDALGTNITFSGSPLTGQFPVGSLVYIEGTGTSADGIWRVLGLGTLYIVVAAEFEFSASSGNVHNVDQISWIKQAESFTQGDAAEDDEWGVIGLEDQKEYDDFTYEVTVNVYQDLPIEQIAVIMGIDDPVNTKVNVENSNPVNLITCYYDGRTNASFMHSYTIQERVYWKTNPKTISYGDYAMWEITGESDYAYSRKVATEEV